MFNKKKKFKHFSLVPHYAAQLLFSALLLLFKDHYILHMLKASDTKLVLTLYNLLNILLCQYTQIDLFPSVFHRCVGFLSMWDSNVHIPWSCGGVESAVPKPCGWGLGC